KLSTLKRLSLLRILSAILGCAFDDLRQRDHERQAKKQRIICSIAAGLLLLVVGGSLYLWDYNRLKVEYYNTMVYRWGVPEGVGKLTEREVAHKNYHFRIESRRRRIQRVACENSARRRDSVDPFESLQEVVYRENGQLENGQLDRVIFKNVRGRIVYIKKYEFYDGRTDRPDSAVVDLLTEFLTPYTFTSVKYTTTEYSTYRSEVTRHLLVFDDNGYPERIRYRNYYGLVRADVNGVVEIGYTRSVNGMVEREDYVYRDTVITRGPAAIGYRTYAYNERWRATETRAYTAQGLPAVDEYGIHLERNEYDRWNNRSRKAYYDAAERPVEDQFGVSSATYEYDGNGFEVASMQYDAQGKLTAGKLGYAGTRSVNDARGNETEKLYVNAGGKPANNSYGFGKYVIKYDNQDRRIEESFFTAEGGPARTVGGRHKTLIEYDQQGNRTRERFLGEDGKPALNDWGYASNRRWYDERGNRVKEERYGIDDKPAAGKGGTFRMTWTYDEKNFLTAWAFYQVNGELCGAIEKYQRDEWGNPIEVSYCDANEELVNQKNGYARMTYTYENGSQKCVRYYDASGREVKPRKEHKKDSKVLIF
ncbi:MAG: hypothetical protein MUF78_09845, partial [Candidatus Edwardsbacteria bacterium]|nr:hypothetical protein [Candidatus Edwardsbacteria bacterium]